MAQTIIYQHKEVPITYFGVAYELTPSDQAQFAAMRQALSERVGEYVYLMPTPTLHVSITHITAARDGDAHYKEYIDFYNNHQEAYSAVLKEVTHQLAPFTLTFDTVEASNQAIIARAQPSAEIDAIRAALAPLPKLDGRNIEPGFVHSTQARYSKNTSLEAIQQTVNTIDFATTVTVKDIHIVRTTKGFVEPHSILETFPLTNDIGTAT